jgi:hypothetical protein
VATTFLNSDNRYVRGSAAGRVFDHMQNGYLWFVTSDSSDSTAYFYRSTDGGANWSMVDTYTPPGGFTDDLAFFIDKDNGVHLVTQDSVAVWYHHGVPDATFTTFTWKTPINVSGGGQTLGFGYDVIAHREGTGWQAHVVTSEYVASATLRHYWSRIAIDSSHSPTLAQGPTELHNYGSLGGAAVAMDFRHTESDPKDVQSSTPSVYVTYCSVGLASNLFFTKIGYSAGVWTPGTERTIDAVAQQEYRAVSLVYDGTRVMITSGRAATGSVIRVYERDEADTTTTARDPTALADGNVLHCMIGVGRTGDVWLVAQGDSSLDFKKIRFNRGSVTWAAAWTLLDADSQAAAGIDASVSVGRGMTPEALGVIWTNSVATPQATKYEALFSFFQGQAFLQGVGSMTPEGRMTFAAEASMQGVGSLTPESKMTWAGGATLQGVGSLNGKALLTPGQDFTVYDGYLQGEELDAVGLIYFEGEGMQNTEVSQPLRPPRSDTGNEPTEVRPESGEIFSQQDFSNGSGQLYFHHEGRDIKRYLWSEGFDVDIDTVGRPATLIHLHDVPAPAYSSSTVGKIVIFNDLPFVIDGTTIKRGNGDFPGAWADDSPHVGETTVTVQDAASSGEYLYAALGANGIHRRDTSAWTHWSDVQATRVAWVKNRILASDGRSIYEVVSAGAAPAAIETLPVGWTFQDIFEVSGFAYGIASNSASGLTRVHAYGLNDNGSAIEKKSETPFPNDQLLVSGVGYLDTAFIGGGIRTPEGGYDPVVYQAGVVDRDRGALSYAKITEGEGAGAADLSVLAFEPVGENVLCGWSLGSGFPFGARDGLALYKLKNGSFFPFLKTTGAGTGKQVRSIASYKGRILFTTRAGGLYYEEPTKYVSSAYLVSSVADWQTTAEKAWDTIEMSHNPLPAGTSVFVDYTTRLPTEGQWTNAIQHAVAGEELKEERLTDLVSRLLAIRIQSFASGDQLRAPSGHGFLVRSNVLPDDAEWRLTRYVRLLKKDRKDGGAEDVYILDTHTRKRDIQLTAYKWVTLYEPGVIWTARMAQIANVTPMIPEFAETRGEERHEVYILQLTMEGVRD